MYNTNAIEVAASANVTVGNAAHRGSYAFASAAALGVSQAAFGGTTSATVTATAFTDAFGVNAYVSQHLVGVSFTEAVAGGSAPTGPALVTLTNTGTIDVAANASAVGEPGATAYANATAVNQHAAALRPSLRSSTTGRSRPMPRHSPRVRTRCGDRTRGRRSPDRKCGGDELPHRLLWHGYASPYEP